MGTINSTPKKALETIGNLFNKIKNKKSTVIMVGLDGAGKSTILHHLAHDVADPTNPPCPTIGVTVETVSYHGVTFNVWDVGGGVKIRQIWERFFNGNDGIIFVVDSSDRSRVEEAKEELMAIVNNPKTKGTPLLIFANKQDKIFCMKKEEISDILCLGELDRKVNVVECSAFEGVSLYDGLDWLATELENS